MDVPTLVVDTSDGYVPSFEEFVKFARTSGASQLGRLIIRKRVTSRPAAASP